ncbi:uncharacterized protein LOC123502281 isoform X1 [Portunus trituberculatus]|uniref:uncharacterized protein LOC123502281 isoform X1 n=1 Tax=Portunus trituberculatus TaxID=210409 RepID=UPI001E1D0C65|nr:uncharacterized protein LOC123502281 isoform X1 [Portunus trituberculatus]XP_045107440.1 uncharacterized protein LOC123502281 isoform X1 [Portunus trituberculatus]
MTADTEDSTNQELVIRSRDCSDPVRPAPSGRTLWLRTAPTLTVAAATATRRGTASHWAFTAVPLIHVSPSQLLALRDFASQRPGKHLLHHHHHHHHHRSPEIQLRIADILLFNACCHYHLIMVVSLYLDLLSLLNNNV